MWAPFTAGLLQVSLLLLAAHSGSAILCHRSLCLDDANITTCTNNHTTQLVNCSELFENDADNTTACVKYSVTGATYRRMSGEDFSPCESLQVRTCFRYDSAASLDLGGRLQDAMRYAGVNETVLDVRVCHADACNAAGGTSWSTAALLVAAAAAAVGRP
ncbi:uncharacterized protein LOC134528084 [Bacillus rossius redtenbacheri]|uniref:uncharacterized protein LOC134528084 n=1 Tax=Bacillus rossius redtenbacheri TaxID=93214 RepID=UPI002FDD1332